MNRAYSLLELLAATGLLVTIATFGFSTLSAITERQQLKLAGESFLSAVQAARFEAVSRNLAVAVRVHPGGRQYGLSLPAEPVRFWQALPENVTFSQHPTREPTFYSRGSASPAGTFVLANGSGSLRVVISVGGRVRWEQGNE